MRQAKSRAIVFQVIFAAGVIAAFWFFVSNAVSNLEARRIATGFGFLLREAGFEIGESTLISYNASDAYLRALAVGLLNTFRVALLAIVCATAIGVAVALSRLSSNALLRRITAAYVEVLRNVPLVVQLFFWYALITESLPAPANALSSIPGVFFSNRGIAFPWFRLDAGLHIEWPALTGFNFSGGAVLSPEFAALFFGLSLYTAAFIAEIVRAGILSVPRGQHEAAQALGLTPRQGMRYVILPQALRAIVPPLTSQYLNCTKNSSLAVAIGYPDLVSIANTAINQTGQAIEGIAIIMMVYLTISLAISGFMNWYNRRHALRGAKA